MNCFSIPVRVYWEDTDAGGVVFYANYLKFFERARTEWLRAAGFEQQAMRESSNILFVVAQAQLRYLAPARLDDGLTVTVQVESMGAASIALVQTVFRDATPLVEGRVRVGCVEASSWKPVRIPLPVRQALCVA